MICYNCGNEISTEGANCPFCGAPLNTSSGQPNPGPYQAGPQQDQPGPQPGPQPNFQQPPYGQPQGGSMDPKTASIIVYITWVGLLIAILSADKENPFFKHHLNNALCLLIASTAIGLIGAPICFIPIIGGLIVFAAEVFILVCAIMGIVSAVNGNMNELPLIGQFKLIK